MKIIGNHAGQFGDLAMDTVLARQIKRQFPDCHYMFGFTKRYAAIEPLFRNHPYIDGTHLWDAEYEDWPTNVDKSFLVKSQFNYILSGFPPHTRDDWWRFCHQTEEACFMYGLERPESKQIYFNKWFEVEKRPKTIAFSVFGGNNSPHKSLSIETLTNLINRLNILGFTCLQLGGKNEPDIQGLAKTNTNYFESVRTMLGCDALICVDSGLNWCASGYEMPVLGLYGHEYYGEQFVKNIQPVNKNALYISRSFLQDIKIDEILTGLKTLLK